MKRAQALFPLRALPLASMGLALRRPATSNARHITPVDISAGVVRWGTNVAGSYVEAERSDRVEDHMNLGVSIKPTSTLVSIWQQAAAAYGSRRFLGSKMWIRGALGYVWTSYASIDREVVAMRRLLDKMGIGRGSRVTVISENRYEWVVVHIATLQLGAQFVAVPTNVTPTDAQAIVSSTQSRLLIVESLATFNTVKGWAGTVGKLQHVLCFEDQQGEGSYGVAIELAAAVTEIDVPVRTDITPHDVACILFTAGTAGPPKGVILTHRALVANLASVDAMLGEAVSHNDMFMSLVSWTIAGALTADLYQVISKGAAMAIPPELIEGMQDLKLVNPSVVTSVALPFQRAFNNIADDILNRGSISQSLTKGMLGKLTEARVMMTKPSTTTRILSELLLGNFKAQFGAQLRLAIIIGVPLTKEQSELLADLDIFTVNTYGCMEAGGLVATDLDVPTKLKVLPGLEVRIVNEKAEVVVPGDLGEVLVEAPHAMEGYFDINVDPEERKNALVAFGGRSFVRTGDFGSMIGGWLTIKGHKDVLITMSTGKVIEPLEVEAALCKSSFINQVFIYGEKRPYVVALIVPNTTAIARFLKKIDRRDGVPIVSDREKADVIRSELRRVSQKMPPRTQVRRFALVEEFTLANGFLTAKHAYARYKITSHYVHYFDALYEETPKFFGFAVDDYDDLF